MANTTKKKTTNKNTVDMSDVITPDAYEASGKLDLNDVSKDSRTIPDSALINVKSNVFGKLIFTSKRNGERVVWEKCGDVMQITFALLRTIKMECVSFFKDQWIIMTGFADENAETFKPADIYKQLFVAQYYKDLVDPSDFESICSMTPDEIRKKVSLMSEGARANLVVALNTYIEKGVLDSLKAIRAFEEVLGCDLRDPD